MKARRSFHEQVAESLIEQLKSGTAPWQKPWKPGNPLLSFPHNPTTGKLYRGINALYLMSKERSDPRWLTYKQAADMGAQVRKGEQSTTVQYWKFTEQRDKTDSNGKPVIGNDGKPVRETVKLQRPRVFYAAVFNAGQIDNMPGLVIEPVQWNPVERAERILEACGVVIEHGEFDRACYIPKLDKVRLPHKHQFETSDRYYATALHEIGHSSGHETRLNRDIEHPFGSEGYAREELRAEIASMMIGATLAIGHDPGQHAAYVASWIKVLQEDPKEIFRAAADAEKIKDYVLALEKQQEQVAQQAIETDKIKPAFETHTASLATVVQHNNRQLQKHIENLPTQEQNALHLVADALKFYRNASIDNIEFEETSQDKLGFVIPADWNGRVAVKGCAVEFDDSGLGRTTDADKLGVDPEFWNVNVQLDNLAWCWVQDFEVELHARDGADKLALIDAMAERNEYEKAVKLARIDELRTGNDPRSTEDDIIDARERRKNAEALAMQNDADFNKRRQDMEARQSVGIHQHHHTNNTQPGGNPSRRFLIVPYSEKDRAKAAGARWDKESRTWYVGEKADIRALQRWLPENVSVQQSPVIDSRAEFATVLRNSGCIVDGNHPVMDGAKQRIKVEGDAAAEKSGFYVGHLDGRPAGYFKNNRTKLEVRWKAKGYTLSDEQKAQLSAYAAIKQQERKAATHQQHLDVAKSIQALLAVAPLAESAHAYLKTKHVRPGDLKAVPDHANDLPADSIIKIGKDWQESRELHESNPGSIVLTAGDLLVPAHDINGQTWSVQIIQPGGSKFFASGGKKEGNFYVAGSNNMGPAALDNAKAIIIAEGYATADTLSSVLDMPVVNAFDSGNLVKVAQNLHEKYPHRPIIIAGDDDHHQASVNGINPGKEKATEAAELVGGITVFPIFAPNEQTAQKLSDFNDLANKSALGVKAVKRQVGSVLENVLARSKAQVKANDLRKNPEQKQQQQTRSLISQ